MADLISRAAAIAELMQMVKAHEHEIFRGELLHYTGIKAMLEAQPAVDAAPVVHGRWLGRRYDFEKYKYVIVPYDVTTFDNPDDLFCSVCNTPALSDGAENDVPSNYCPNCGAKMDGERMESE